MNQAEILLNLITAEHVGQLDSEHLFSNDECQ